MVLRRKRGSPRPSRHLDSGCHSDETGPGPETCRPCTRRAGRIVPRFENRGRMTRPDPPARIASLRGRALLTVAVGRSLVARADRSGGSRREGAARAALHEITLHLVLGSALACFVVLAFMRSWRDRPHQAAARRRPRPHPRHHPGQPRPAAPILMTTLTLVACRLSLALGTGPGAEERYTIAVVVIGGQSLSLLLTLVVTRSSTPSSTSWARPSRRASACSTYAARGRAPQTAEGAAAGRHGRAAHATVRRA